MTEPQDYYHTSVLLQEVLHYLQPTSGETMCDLTLGGAGHAYVIGERLTPHGTLIGLDRDPEALQYASARLEPLRAHLSIILIHSAFENIRSVLEENGLQNRQPLDGVLFDLGVSSRQLDTERGFSFRREERLDMRMDTTTGITAEQWLATTSETEIARVLWEFGEERWSRRIASTIVNVRKREPIQTTLQLARIVEQSVPRSGSSFEIHVATRTFQAIRIAINRELEQLEAALEDAIDLLRPGGRLVAISFHSLEDRIVKQILARRAGRVSSPPGSSPAALLQPETGTPELQILTKKPVTASPEEVKQNPRARSAKLRSARKIV